MDWIEAALAFAVVMMLLSTAVTVVMEAAHNLLRIREKGLRRLVEGVYENVVVPRLPRLAGDATAAGFVETVTGARYLPVSDGSAEREGSSWFGRVKRWFKHLVYRTVNATQLKELSTLDFVERLAETPAGRRLFEESQRRGDEYLETFLGDLASKFEDFSRSSSEYFARRARLTSTVIAMILAFSLNVSAVHVYATLLKDDNLRASLISQGEDVAKQMQAVEERLAKAVEDENAEFDKEELDKRIEELRSIVKSLEETGLPIGWANVPWKSPAGTDRAEKPETAAEGEKSAPAEKPLSAAADDKTAPAAAQEAAGTAQDEAPISGFKKFLLIVGWVFSVALAGLLIGLGGPFWFNVFNKLGALAGTMRGGKAPVQKPKESDETPSDDESKTITRVFRQAAMADALAGPAGRALLTPDGRVDPADSR